MKSCPSGVVRLRQVAIAPAGLAHVWAKYVFYFSGKPDHCGTESYSLFRTQQGWKIFSFADTDTPLHESAAAEVCPG